MSLSPLEKVKGALSTVKPAHLDLLVSKVDYPVENVYMGAIRVTPQCPSTKTHAFDHWFDK